MITRVRQFVRVSGVAAGMAALLSLHANDLHAQTTKSAKQKPTSAVAARPQDMREQTSLDMWIVQRFRGAQLLPDSGARSTATLAQAGAPCVEAARNTTRRDTVVALHFGPAMWRASIMTATPVQLADPSGSISGITGKVTARRAFRAPRVAAARDSVKDDWRIGWAYLVAIPVRSANASPSGFAGWALAETPVKNTAKTAKPAASNSQKDLVEQAISANSAATQSTPPAPMPPMR